MSEPARSGADSSARPPLVGVVMGSDSDLPTMQAAIEALAEFGLSAAQLDAAWGSASITKQQVLMSAMSQLGVPYRSRMSKAYRGFDCSGLMLYAYAQAGIALPRSSGEQIRSAAELTLEPGENRVRVVRDGLRSNLVVLELESARDGRGTGAHSDRRGDRSISPRVKGASGQ